MINKSVIAHELGHAVCGEVQDGFWAATSLTLETDDNNLAYCHCYQLDVRKDTVNSRYSKLSEIFNLGGIFGELLFEGAWNPWGSRADLDEFVTANSNSRSALKEELDDWFFRDTDPRSYHACSRKRTTTERRLFKLDAHDTATRLPELWKVYLDFCNRIDKDEFKRCVAEISVDGENTVPASKLKPMLKRVTNG